MSSPLARPPAAPPLLSVAIAVLLATAPFLLAHTGCSAGSTPPGAPGSGGASEDAGGGGGAGSGGGGSSAGGAGGNADAAAGGAGGGGRGGAGGGARDSGAGGAPVTPCPPTLPTTGACAPEDRICSYGDLPRVECRGRARCSLGSWLATQPMACTAATDCPTTVPSGPCDGAMVDRFCRIGGTECKCVGNMFSGTWVCQTPTRPPDPCPMTVPNAGTACADAVSCAYPCNGLPLSSIAVTATCVAGMWTWQQTNCGPPAI